jgi:DNA-directed RNA polymerase subunit RPC12/RpoP
MRSGGPRGRQGFFPREGYGSGPIGHQGFRADASIGHILRASRVEGMGVYFRCLTCGRLAALADSETLVRCPSPTCGSMNSDILDAETARALLQVVGGQPPSEPRGSQKRAPDRQAP